MILILSNFKKRNPPLYTGASLRDINPEDILGSDLNLQRARIADTDCECHEARQLTVQGANDLVDTLCPLRIIYCIVAFPQKAVCTELWAK